MQINLGSTYIIYISRLKKETLCIAFNLDENYYNLAHRPYSFE